MLLDLGLEENLDTGLIGRFFNAVDEGVEPLVKHKAGVIALSDAGAHLVYLCDAGFGLYLLGHWVRERGTFDLPEGVRRLTSHQAGLYGIPDRGRIAVGANADLLLFDPATVGSRRHAGSPTCLAAGPARSASRSAFTAYSSMGFGFSTAKTMSGLREARDKCSTAFCRPVRRLWRAQRSSLGREDQAMPVDPQIQVLLDRGPACRNAYAAGRSGARAIRGPHRPDGAAAEIAGVREQTIDGPGGPLRIRIYTPHGRAHSR